MLESNQVKSYRRATEKCDSCDAEGITYYTTATKTNRCESCVKADKEFEDAASRGSSNRIQNHEKVS